MSNTVKLDGPFVVRFRNFGRQSRYFSFTISIYAAKSRPILGMVSNGQQCRDEGWDNKERATKHHFRRAESIGCIGNQGDKSLLCNWIQRRDKEKGLRKSHK